MSGKRILITGGAGFIGTHLCKKLLMMGHEVFCLDNLFTGSKSNLSDMMAHPRFHFLLQDVTVPVELEVDEIYSLACPASPVHYQYNPVKTIQTSILGAINVLELARNKGARVLQASTSEVYGDPVVHPQREDYWGNVNPIGIRSCYDESKRCAETLFFDYHRQYGVDIKVVRIFNTYGPMMHPNDGRVVSNFIVQALKNEDITIYGKGMQTRSFCYIDDLIAGMIKMMESEQGFTGPLNLGNPSEFTIIELAQNILDLTGSNSNLSFKPLPQDDPGKRKPDIQLAKRKLSWEPKINLDDGLKRTISYFKQVLA